MGDRAERRRHNLTASTLGEAFGGGKRRAAMITLPRKKKPRRRRRGFLVAMDREV
jgi:hypothetical protein